MVLPQIRLWIEYALIGAVIVFAGLAVTVKMESLRHEAKIEKLSGKVDAAETRLGVVEGVNQAQKQIIEDLANQRDLDGKSIVSLMDTYQKLTITDRSLRKQLNDLEKNDEARTYLDGAVPDPVGCLYDGSCPPAAAGDPPGAARIPPGSLLHAPEEKAPDKPGIGQPVP